MSTLSKKICIIGESKVCKNSLIHQLGEHQFSDGYLSRLGVTISKITLELPGVKQPDKLKLQLIIWNLATNPKYKAIAPSYLRGSSGAIIVADIGCPETIEQIPEHIKLFSSINPKSFIIVALNQSDLMAQEKLVQLKDFKRVSGIYLTSVKTSLYVDKIFQQIAYKLLETRDNCSTDLESYSEIVENSLSEEEREVG